ncbi:MAG: cysteine desulfurase family protein [Acutalibacteraceae bacterium]|nr:cysteine desulfurase family protein [Acutalibacteraceae bacterium]
MRTVYLDNSATTMPCKEAVNKINRCLTENWGNPSSSYYLGIEAMEEVQWARKTIARHIGVNENEIFFTSCGSEANNLALFGTANAKKKTGKKIVSTTIEHPSVLEALNKLGEDGFEIVLLSPDKNGVVPDEAFINAIDKNTILVSVMLVNNEIGSIQNIKRVSEIIKQKGSPALLHCDAVQGFGKIPIRVSSLGVDLLSASGHKIHASKGIGFLYKSAKVHITPLIFGGGQENGLRSGTECVPLIAGMGAAVDALPDLKEQLSKWEELNAYAKVRLSEIECIKFNSPENAIPCILNISVDGYKSEPMLNALSSKNIFISKGSACSKGHRSYVLKEIGVNASLIDSALRISFSRETTKEDIDSLAEAIREITSKMRRFK